MHSMEEIVASVVNASTIGNLAMDPFLTNEEYPISLDHLRVCQNYENVTTNDHLVSNSWISTYYILSPITVVSNLIVMVSIWTHDQLHTMTYSFIFNLALADCLVGITMPMWSFFYTMIEIYNDESVCLFMFVIVFISYTSSITTLLAVAFDRFLYITYPLHYHTLMTERRGKQILIAIWVYSITVGCLPIKFSFWNQKDESHVQKRDYTVCIMECVLHKGYLVFLSFQYIAFTAIIAIFYFCIYNTAKSQKQKILQELSICRFHKEIELVNNLQNCDRSLTIQNPATILEMEEKQLEVEPVRFHLPDGIDNCNFTEDISFNFDQQKQEIHVDQQKQEIHVDQQKQHQLPTELKKQPLHQQERQQPEQQKQEQPQQQQQQPQQQQQQLQQQQQHPQPIKQSVHFHGSFTSSIHSHGSFADSLSSETSPLNKLQKQIFNPKKKFRNLLHKTTSMFIILLIFVLCWTPFHFLIVFNSLGKLSTNLLTARIAFLFAGIANSALNPLVYAMRMKALRKALKWTLKKFYSWVCVNQDNA